MSQIMMAEEPALIRSQTQGGQPVGVQQIVLNEKQFNLIKKVYPQAFQTQQPFAQAAAQSFVMGPTNTTPQFSLQDP